MTAIIDGNANASFSHDLNSISNIKSNPDAAAALDAAAGQFEALFLQNVLKSMRSASDSLQDPDDKLFKEQPIYRDMYDSQLAMHLSSRGGMGLKQQLVQQLTPTLPPTLKHSAQMVASSQHEIAAFSQPLINKK